jgi:GNAT superfamily N-acetyltransferase
MQNLATDPILATVRLRDAQPTDRAAIEGLSRHLAWIQAEALPDLFRPPDHPGPHGDNFIDAALNDDRQKVVVADVGGQAVAFIHLTIKLRPAHSLHNERCYAEVETIVVDPLYQGNGIGRRLIECALGWAASQGVIDSQANAPSFNKAARALYELMGFKPAATILYRNGDVRMRASEAGLAERPEFTAAPAMTHGGV